MCLGRGFVSLELSQGQLHNCNEPVDLEGEHGGHRDVADGGKVTNSSPDIPVVILGAVNYHIKWKVQDSEDEKCCNHNIAIDHVQC